MFFDYWNQYYIGIINNLLTPINLSINRDIKDYEDKLIVSMSFLYDHLFKFHRNAFSWRNIESTPELIDVNKNPELRAYITNIINLLLKTHLEEIINGQYDFKFPKKVSQEMTFLSRVSAEASASFNFALDESLALKQMYRDKLAEVLEFNQGNKGDYFYDISSLCITLGDLHFFDDEFGQAITHYLEAIHPIRNKNVEKLSVTQMALLTRNMLKMGYANEKRKAYDFAFITHLEMSDKIIKFFTYNLDKTNDETTYSKEYDKEFAKSALENIRFFYQPLLAKLQLIEKTSLDGITGKDIKRIENEFDLITKMFAVKPDGTENLKSYEEKEVLYSEFWNKLGDILFFKNGKINVREKGKECLWYCHNRTKESGCYKACDSCHFYFKSFKVMSERFDRYKEEYHCINKTLSIIDVISRSTLLNVTQEGNLNNKEDIIALAFILSNIADAYLSCSTQKELNLRELKRFIEAFDDPDNTIIIEDNNIVRILTRKKRTPLLFKLNKLNELDTVIILLYLTGWFYKKIGDHKNYSHQLVKILQLLKLNYEINPIKSRLGDIDIIKEIFVNKAIRGFYRAHDHVHTYETEEFKDILDANYSNLLHEQISLNRTSINSDLNEVLYIFYQIKLMLRSESDPEKLEDLYSLCTPFTLNTNMYNRIIKLDYRLKLNMDIFSTYYVSISKSHESLEQKKNEHIQRTTKEHIEQKTKEHIETCKKFKKLVLEDIQDNLKVLNADYNHEMIEFLISDSIFCCFEILKLCKIFGLSYGINHSIIAKAHEDLWKWSDYLNYYILIYEVFQIQKDSIDKEKFKEEIIKITTNKLNLHIRNDDSETIDKFYLSDNDRKLLEDKKFFQGETIIEKIGTLIEKDNLPFIAPLYQCEKAIRAYYSVLETHSEGVAYKNFIENMYFLNDDYNDKYYHFHAALERYAIHSGHVQNQISYLKERVENSVTYKSENYQKTKVSKNKQNHSSSSSTPN